MKKILIYVACLLWAVSCSSDVDFGQTCYSTETSTEWGARMVAGTDGYISHVNSDSVTDIDDGVQVLRMQFLNRKGHAMHIFVFKVRLSDKITIKTTLPDNLDRVGACQTMMEQANAMDFGTVLGCTNADFYNTSTYVPYGYVWRNGNAVKSTADRNDCNVFTIDKDGKAHCYTDAEFASERENTLEAVSGRSLFLWSNGEKVNQATSSSPASKLEPRTCIGVGDDGSTVYIMVVDGRVFTYSEGIDMYDLATLIGACGVDDAINLDGGGSSTFIARVGGELKLLNRPSDNNGQMRAVANGLAIVKK